MLVCVISVTWFGLYNSPHEIKFMSIVFKSRTNFKCDKDVLVKTVVIHEYIMWG